MYSRMACLLERSHIKYNEHAQGHNIPQDAFRSHRSGLNKHVWKTSALQNYLLDYSWLHLEIIVCSDMFSQYTIFICLAIW